jgi:hypothetical protein
MHTAEPFCHSPVPQGVEAATGKLKRYKSPGVDQIPEELVKAGGETPGSESHKFIKLIGDNDELPLQWKESTVVPIHKKGNKMASNYRGIPLLATS